MAGAGGNTSAVVIEIQVQNWEEIAKRLETPPSRAIDAVTHKAAAGFHRNVQAAAPRRSGKLASAVRLESVAPAWYVITENLFYGKLQRQGSKHGYEIGPVTARALWWPERPGKAGWGAPHPFAFIGPPVTELHPGIVNTTQYDIIGIQNSGVIFDDWMFGLSKAYAAMVEYGRDYGE